MDSGDQVTCKAVSEEQLGGYSLFEITVPPQGGLPAHIHHWEKEAYYILEGELLIQEGDRTFMVSAGSFVDFPKGILHTLIKHGNSVRKATSSRHTSLVREVL